MQLIEALYKIVENPTSSQNYKNIKQYFQEKGLENIASAFDYLIETRYGNNSNSTEQERQD
jgi:hypothetical protein